MGLIEEQQKKYPLMQIEDKIKLLLQAYMGPAHLVGDKEVVKKRLLDEYNNIEVCCDDDLIEEIGEKYVRVYIKPYYLKYKSFDNLVEAFILSSNEQCDIYSLEKALLDLRVQSKDADRKVIDEYFSSGNLLISHSKIYKENYHPHYLVISKKFLDIL